jgi:putative inorganic carbon (HCO3(-)) transporter
LSVRSIHLLQGPASALHRPRFQHASLLIVPAIALALAFAVLQAVSYPAPAGPLILVAVVAPFVVMIVGNLRLLLLAVVMLDIPFQWDVNLHYSTSAEDLGALGGINVSLTTFAIAGLYALWSSQLLVSASSTAKPRVRAAGPLLAYIGFSALSVAVARNHALAEYELLLLVQTFLVFLYLASNVRTAREIRFIVTMLVLGLALESALIIVTEHLGRDWGFLGISAHHTAGVDTGQEYRIGGTLGSANTAASYLAFLLPAAVMLVAAPIGRWSKRLGVVAFLFGVTALILTFSRGGWVAFAASVVFLAVAGWRRGLISPQKIVLVVIAVLLLAIPFFGPISNRLTGDDLGAARSRLPLIRLATKVIEHHPILGVGLNNVPLVLPSYAGPEYGRVFLSAVHNKYLLVWAEAGLAAFVAFLWFLLATVRNGMNAWKANDGSLSPIALGLTAGLVGQLVHMNFDIFQSRPQVQLLWVVSALLVAIRVIQLKEQGQP